MNLRRAMGIELTEEQAVDLIVGRKILMQEMVSKNGKAYSAYLLPVGIDEYAVKGENGEKMRGYQYKFRLEFVN